MRWRLNKPYYLFRPGQALSRIRFSSRMAHRPEFDDVVLPWGLPLRIRPREQIGAAIARRGLFDLTVSETLYRLTDPGDLALDIGANIGHMTSILALRVGPSGKVIAFEPHPQVYEDLELNTAQWSCPHVGPIALERLALSDRGGTGSLGMKAAFVRNMGSAAIFADADPRMVSSEQVDLERLDHLVTEPAGVMKVDVEGHELAVLQGATGLLARSAIRDVVFEEFDRPPTPVTQLLEGFGYRVFSLDQGVLGPRVGALDGGSARRSLEDPSYLATVDPERALARLRPRGWRVLSRRFQPGACAGHERH